MNYIEISLSIIEKIKRPLMFDVYIKRGKDSYTKIFMKDDLIDLDRVKSYKDKGVSNFYVEESDYSVYCLYVEKIGEALAGSVGKFSPEESSAFIKELVGFSMHEMITKQNVDERSIKAAGNVVNACVETLKSHPKGLVKIISLMANQPYLVKHSVSVSLFSVLLAKKLNIESDSALSHIGLGGFLHDVGVGQLTFDPEDTELLSPEQRQEVGRHPDLGRQQLDQVKGIRSEVLQIVAQHHEQPNGKGYPNGLLAQQIYMPAKIVSIADNFSALISGRSYRDAFATDKALAIMAESTGKFDASMLETFKSIFIKV
jgi:HD-GYP domain-containing protein (c-di-GMP phosphodiesterase class II)